MVNNEIDWLVKAFLLGTVVMVVYTVADFTYYVVSALSNSYP